MKQSPMSRPSSISGLFLILLSGFFVSGCEFDSHISVNSSEGDNDYFEEPLTARSEKFSPALEISNKFIDLFSSGQLDEARGLFDEEFSQTVSPEDLRSIRQQVLDGFGPMTEYLPMQWGFSTLTEDGEKVVYSTKIVVHEKAAAFYIFAFADDEKYDRIYGLNVRRRNGDETINHALTAVRDGT